MFRLVGKTIMQGYRTVVKHEKDEGNENVVERRRGTSKDGKGFGNEIDCQNKMMNGINFLYKFV